MTLLKFIATNLKNLDVENQKLMLKSIKKNINEFVDLVFSSQQGEENSCLKPYNAEFIWKNLGSNFETF